MANREVQYVQASQYKDGREASDASDDESISETGSASNGYDPEWLEEVSEAGDLFYIGASLPVSEEHSVCEGRVEAEYGALNPNANGNNINHNNGLHNSQKAKLKGKGKLKALIKHNKLLKNGDLGPREVPGAEDVGPIQLPKVTFQDPRGELKEVHLDVDPNRHNYGRRASPCEVLFGIIPGRFHNSRSGLRDSSYASSGAKDDARIMIQGLLPDGEAIRSQSIKIGDCLQRVNGVEVTYFNINQVLGSITYPTKVKLTLQGFAGHDPSEETRLVVQPVHKTKLAKLVSRIGHQQEEEPVVPTNIPHVVLYLTVEGISEFSAGKQDVIYQYPEVDNKLVQVRGMFITIAHMLPDVTSSYPLSSSLTIDNKLIHVGYAVDGNEVLVIGIPDECIPLSRLHQLMKDIVRMLKLQYHTLHKAFTQPMHKVALDHMFALSFQWLLSNRSKPSSSIGKPSDLTFKDCVPAAEWLSLPSHVQLEVDNVLSEFEAAEFVEMSEDYYDARRLYNILGTCVFYKSYLMANHLSKEDLLDVFLYLKHYGLLTLTHAEPISQIVVWKEVFPTQHLGTGDNSTNTELTETQGRYFLLVVGVKQQLMGVLLEAGGCSSRAQGHPSPDPFYIDQALATLLHLESLHIPATCDNWLNCTGVPVANVEWFIHSGKGNKDETSFRTRDSSPGGSGVKSVPQNLRKSQTELTSILKKKSSTSQHFTGSNTALCDNESDTSHSMATSATSSMSDETTPVMARRNQWSQGRTSGSDADSRASSDGALYRSAKTSRLLPGSSSLDLSSLYKNLPDSDAAAMQLTTGCENVLFHYLQLDTAEGVIISPRQQESGSMLSTEVLDNFQASCLMIQQVFHNTLQYKEMMKSKEVPRLGIAHSLGAIKEHGVLFQCSLPPRPNQKKPSPTVTYWVVGRLFSGLNPREVYVCFLDSIPQNVIEIAFRLGFGVTT